MSITLTSTNSLIRAFDDVDGALAAILGRSSSTWKSMKKSKKGDKMPKLRFIGDTFWSIMKEMKSTVKDSVEKSIRRSAMSLLKHVRMYRESNTLNSSTGKMEAVTSIVSKTIDGVEVCDNFHEALHLDCVKYKMTPPIVLYGRLYEEERFQYVSFIFGQRVFIIELTFQTYRLRACETMSALMRKFCGVPKFSSFIKVQRNVAHIVAEVNLHTKMIVPSELVPDDLQILNLNEITELIMASHYLMNQPRTRVEQIYAETLAYKQHFLEGMYVNNKRVFGYVDPDEEDEDSPVQHPTTTIKSDKGDLSEQPIILVFCDTTTQSNFLWNDKPWTVNVKQLAVTDGAASNVSYDRLELLPIRVVSNADECSGVRYGEKILYDGPLVNVL